MAKKKKSSKSTKSPTVKIKAGKRSVRLPLWIFLILVAVAAIALGVVYALGGFGKSEQSSSSEEPTTSYSYSDDDSAPISFNFIAANNGHSGDSTYIKAGDVDILIDAGSLASSASTITSYMTDSSRAGNYVNDGKLEYVIATHAHKDHISGFYGTSDSSKASGKTGILYNFDIDTLIDFNLTNLSGGSGTVYGSYLTARDYAVNKGTKHFTALQCYNNEGNGASRTYELGKNLTMSVLYNYYYENNSSDENNYSVCLLFTQGSKNFLFTGDLESSGEAKLVTNNTLPEVELFKGGHHGSYTANTDALLSVIKPKLVCICACAGNNEYASDENHAFPAQEAINRIAPYTDRVYVTDLGSWSNATYVEPMNGNILVNYDEKGNEELKFSHNSLKLKETQWFLNKRTMPSAWAS
ncbi:MAG: hypothetical protein LKF58_00880 [Bacilli bacterium]|jgi:beta-lactamase superfamily II metal-dependent hydrolase|nr:hypothetical protein [Bacilli bacterium]MCH4210324.1 hypothetical protein [Bacilli bacterium]MCH4278108.1 hypothetical protein [Bacilli bacterium]MCI2055416.1 hypothetical protein [Bacilli bacterium]